MDLLSNLAIPDITSAQLAPVKPDFNAGRAERLVNSPPRLSILRGVAQEYGSRWWTRLYRRLWLHARSLNPIFRSAEHALTIGFRQRPGPTALKVALKKHIFAVMTRELLAPPQFASTASAAQSQILATRRRSALPITDRELKLMATAAIMG